MKTRRMHRPLSSFERTAPDSRREAATSSSWSTSISSAKHAFPLYPTVEELRAEYGDRVTFVVRYLPLHGNSVEAAQAAEAAKEQGEFEAMYKALFDNATEWGHQETSQRELFFSYAEEIGLDMERFEQVYDDPATTQRIEQSAADAEALGVTGTPTFFVDGKPLEPTRVEDLTNPLDTALEG